MVVNLHDDIRENTQTHMTTLIRSYSHTHHLELPLELPSLSQDNTKPLKVRFSGLYLGVPNGI